ncbi:MAG: helix-turn-helix transcriptional regulator [Candidatus Rokuibacteriota bacterium]
MPRGDQLSRQWRLLQFLGRSQGLAVEDAAREVGCTVRTVWRDLRVLHDFFPIYDERDGRRSVWKVEKGLQDRLPVPLSLPEVVALLVSGDLLGAGGTGPFGPAAAAALAKIRALLTPRALELVGRMRAGVGARAIGAKVQLGGGEHMVVVQQALAERRTLEVRYYSLSRDAETDRRVDPYHLTFVSGGLYLVGFCHLRREVRVFAVERIRAATAARETFTVPPDFDAEAYLRSAWGIVRGALIGVRAVFSPSVAPHVRGRLWHASQELRELAGGRLEMRLAVADTLEVRRWLQGFGAEVEVLAPPALREAIRLEAERVASALAPARKPPARVAGSAGLALRAGDARQLRVAGAPARTRRVAGRRAVR